MRSGRRHCRRWIIEQVIRGAIGFDGVLVSDDLCMKALRGAPGALARRRSPPAATWCCIATASWRETAAALAGCPALSDVAESRLAEARAADAGAAAAAECRQPHGGARRLAGAGAGLGVTDVAAWLPQLLAAVARRDPGDHPA